MTPIPDLRSSTPKRHLQALCGRVGGKIRSEYAMVGDVINLAARLMSKAKGRIVCDEVTHDTVRDMHCTWANSITSVVGILKAVSRGRVCCVPQCSHVKHQPDLDGPLLRDSGQAAAHSCYKDARK